ncbi:CRISPR-associated protein Crm3 [Corallococcus sp. H22C18031201]|nr:CRISPR-associated protein Crm3 [Corallococcus sp. H22C18031201]
MKTACFALLPREGLFCKNGRGWYTSEVGRSHAHPWPPPSTVRGALRAAWGQSLLSRRGSVASLDWERETQAVAVRHLLTLWRPLGGGPFTPEHRLWPVPADALQVDGALRKLLPCPLPEEVGTLGEVDDDALEALWVPRLPKAKPEPQPEFWTEESMVRWLRGEVASGRPAPKLERRTQVHVTLRSQTQVAEQGMLYQTELLESVSAEPGEWALGIACAVPDEVKNFPSGWLGLGGKRRLSAVESLSTQVFSAPRGLPASSPGLRLVLATPARFENGWLPDGLRRATHQGRPAWVGTLPGMREEVVLRAALVPRPLELSTWNMVKREPRATRRLVPAGATYFFEKVDGKPFIALEQWWLASWGGDQEEGSGLVLPGHWNPEEGRT